MNAIFRSSILRRATDSIERNDVIFMEEESIGSSNFVGRIQRINHRLMYRFPVPSKCAEAALAMKHFYANRDLAASEPLSPRASEEINSLLIELTPILKIGPVIGFDLETYDHGSRFVIENYMRLTNIQRHLGSCKLLMNIGSKPVEVKYLKSSVKCIIRMSLKDKRFRDLLPAHGETCFGVEESNLVKELNVGELSLSPGQGLKLPNEYVYHCISADESVFTVKGFFCPSFCG